ncbi:uncharacterized protein LOC131152147 isoform X2 [Malania oleifera]|uniref:uncharacterized protein LOC131152147 isoform X2 n=1 Tax=Malania oleifera TaxID=397392 RepID=UPI0025AD9DBD|nr:uncharacterized protein LOC131152147 isoform X2 [Malania oleifera]
MAMEKSCTPTKLDYYDDTGKLHSTATLLSSTQVEDGRLALLLDSTIFHPQGGGQPADTGFIIPCDSDHVKFIVQDVRSRDGIVFHYGFVENSEGELSSILVKGKEVVLHVDEPRRKLNSRSFVEYKGTVPQDELQSKQKELELEANALISRGGKVFAAVVPYEEASELCGGCLPDYIATSSTPRIVKLGGNPGCPCGGTHVSDISEIVGIKVTRIRTKKGVTKVNYTVAA